MRVCIPPYRMTWLNDFDEWCYKYIGEHSIDTDWPWWRPWGEAEWLI